MPPKADCDQSDLAPLWPVAHIAGLLHEYQPIGISLDVGKNAYSRALSQKVWFNRSLWEAPKSAFLKKLF